MLSDLAGLAASGPGTSSVRPLSRRLGRDAVRVALVSVHASPLVAIGGVNARGQDVHVAELASGLVRLGHSVAVYTRRDDPDLTEWVTTSAGYEYRVQLVGPVVRRHMPALLGSADLVVCAPWYESFGTVPLEAMACGVPVVATAVGGMLDTVVDGVTGVHVLPRDPAALAEVIGALLQSPRRCAELARAGLVRVRSRYSWDRAVADTAAVYERTVYRFGWEQCGYRAGATTQPYKAKKRVRRQCDFHDSVACLSFRRPRSC